MHPFKVLAVLVVVSALVVMCTSASSFPEDSTVLAQARAELNAKYGDVGDLLDLQALTIDKVEPAETTYDATVKYVYRFSRSLEEEIRQWEANSPQATSFKGGAKSLAILEMRNRFGSFKAGDTFDGTLTLKYTKSEEGWAYNK